MIGVVLRQSGPDAFEIHGEDGAVYYAYRKHVVGRVDLVPGERVNFARGIVGGMALNIRKLDGKVYTSAHPQGKKMRGKVLNFNDMQGWGFVQPDDGGADVYLHKSQLADSHMIRVLTTGTPVEFEIGPSQRKPGKTMAVNVRVLE
jgi:CspA family cold shock protein